MSVEIRVVDFNTFLVVFGGRLEITEVIVGTCKVEVALRTLVVDFEGTKIGSNGFFKFVEHVQCVTEIVKGRCILGVQLNSL